MQETFDRTSAVTDVIDVDLTGMEEDEDEDKDEEDDIQPQLQPQTQTHKTTANATEIETTTKNGKRKRKRTRKRQIRRHSRKKQKEKATRATGGGNKKGASITQPEKKTTQPLAVVSSEVQILEAKLKQALEANTLSWKYIDNQNKRIKELEQLLLEFVQRHGKVINVDL